MAIPFLNNLNLNNNEVQNVKLHNTGSAPNNDAGQIYFNTSDTLAKYYSNGTDLWVSLKEYSFTNGTFVDVTTTGTTVKPIIELDLSATGTPSSNTFLRGDNTWATPAYYSGWTLAGDSGASQSIDSGNTATFAGGNKITTVAGATDTLTINHDTTTVTPTTSSESPTYGGTFNAIDSVTYDSYGHITGFNTATVTLPSSDDTTYNLTTAPTGTAIRLTGSDATNDDVTISGTTNEVEVTRISGTELRVGLPDDVTITGELTVSGTGQSSFGGQVTVPATPSANTDAASKGYVDNALAGSGALIYQGGYNANTNTPDLDSSPSSSIKKGWTYTVTADGTFFTEQVRVGDVLIAEQDAPAALSDWTTVQSNIDLATTTTVGIASFSSDNFAVSAAGQVTIKNDGVILGTETTGNYVATITEGAGIDVTGSGTESAAVEITLDLNELTVGAGSQPPTHLAGNDAIGNTRKFTVASIADEITAVTGYSGLIGGSTSITVTSATHGLGTDSSSFMIQLIEVSSGDTVFADVNRGASGAVTISFATAPAANAIRVLIQKIG
jgi:hypothetical protein